MLADRECDPVLGSPHCMLHSYTCSTGQLPVAVPSRGSSSRRSGCSSSRDAQQHQQGVSVKLRKPVGIVFAQNKNGPVFVEEVTPGSNADQCGEVQVGDVLDQCSAVVLKAGKEGQYEREGYGQRPYDNWETS
ncbi:hypothetical protein COO60DRAFT_1702280 [Scenedesmus sp. NREL 46B-D3]|nr:hypothetical protein COO60DRAFT_1702280 [Scenedesmus sp. NREL 46B-D3]